MLSSFSCDFIFAYSLQIETQHTVEYHKKFSELKYDATQYIARKMVQGYLLKFVHYRRHFQLQSVLIGYVLSPLCKDKKQDESDK